MRDGHMDRLMDTEVQGQNTHAGIDQAELVNFTAFDLVIQRIARNGKGIR